MTDIQKELEPIVESYYNELISQDTSILDGYEFSDRYIKRKEELIAKISPPKIKCRHSIKRKVIIALIAAALIGTITVAAYGPARRLFMNIFSDHTEITPAEDNSAVDMHKATIEKKYSITVPDGFVLDEAGLIDTDTYVIHCYYNSDKSDTIVFEQTVKSAFKVSVDNEQFMLATKTDKYGNEYLIYNYNGSITIIWDNGEYIFELSGQISEAEIMKMYYSVK